MMFVIYNNLKGERIMEKYSGNAICEYIRRKGLDLYYCSAKNNWMLIYGNIDSIPKIMVFVISVKDINCVFSDTEKQEMHKALSIARYLGLPFMVVGTKEKNEFVKFWKEGEKKWEIINYDKLRDIYQEYGVVQQGSAKKRVNQYVSSSYHIWQREALGPITVSDLDLIKYDKDRVQEIIELKRSKIALDQWKPFEKDYPNFALLINAIVLSGKNIPFTLYYLSLIHI